MPRAGFEPNIPVFERAKTVHALDREATVIGNCQGIVYVFMYTYASTVDASKYKYEILKILWVSYITKDEFKSHVYVWEYIKW
jgi:hypothetical protein